eukprot:TRINITY_DN953_c0_g1_i2.p1 TRINITY_DN953_c0_g1~~TRINITY_DN953_c0_g1_i2.p1  ORF type:complete len:190 (-),score=10.08 TRINITY_DN953_c0_g1_i2:734-1303(-)
MSAPTLSVDEATAEGKTTSYLTWAFFAFILVAFFALATGFFYARHYYDSVPVANYTRLTRCYIIDKIVREDVCQSDCNCRINATDSSNWHFNCDVCVHQCFISSWKVMFNTESNKGIFGEIKRGSYSSRSSAENALKRRKVPFLCVLFFIVLLFLSKEMRLLSSKWILWRRVLSGFLSFPFDVVIDGKG